MRYHMSILTLNCFTVAPANAIQSGINYAIENYFVYVLYLPCSLTFRCKSRNNFSNSQQTAIIFKFILLKTHIVGQCSAILSVLFLQFLRHKAKLVIPFLPELLYEGFAQEAVDW